MEWLEIYMLMYPDHLQNWLDFANGLLIFLILVPFWPSETGQIGVWGGFSLQCEEGMA